MKRSFDRITAGLLMAGFAFFNPLPAQNEKTCGTEHMYQQQLLKDPSVAGKRKALDDFCEQYVSSRQGEQSLSAPKIIPTVVHIIHFWGAENISDAQVYNAISIANEDLQKLNADTTDVIPAFQSVIGNCNIQLRLAQKDPNGNCTNGITRTVSPLTYEADDNVKQLISWDNSKYLNIWVVASISFGAGGYAYYPGTAPPGGEGIVVLHTQFGGIGTSGGSNFAKRTLTHELGHYFNLPHTWGSSNSCGDAGNCSVDDGVSDTPNTKGNCQTCNLSASTCNELDNVQNYMDYSTCSKMFTAGQAARTDAALNSSAGYRNNLWQPSNLSATGTDMPLPPCIPVAFFKESSYMLCAGDSITFTDLSTNAIVTSWSWSFPGGTPSSSSLQNPTVTYATPGTYSVSLTAGTSSGTSTYTKTGHIIVSPLAATHSNWQYYDGFDGISNGDWTVRDTNNITWQQASTYYSPSSCAYINNISNEFYDYDELISPSVDLTAITNPSLRFKVAFAQRDTSKDVLRVYLSYNCGKTWILRYAEVGPGLATVPAQFSPFVPNNISQWRMETISLNNYSMYDNVRFKFHFTSKGGNNIYIDDVHIAGPLGLDETRSAMEFSLSPNPASGSAGISFTLATAQQVSLTVHDMLGKEVMAMGERELGSGKQDISFDTSAYPPGVYFISLKIGDAIITEKLLVQ
ncbi:MAG: M43 family zinc metalloprotease [Bacteroidota bacterium]